MRGSGWPKAALPGFWPLRNSEQLPAWEVLLGEKPRIYGDEASGMVSGNAHGYLCLSKAAGNIPAALAYLTEHPEEKDLQRIKDEAGDFEVEQVSQGDVDFKYLPRPITQYYRYVNRRRCSLSTERSLIPSIMPQGVSHIHPVLSLTRRNKPLACQWYEQWLCQ